MTKKETESIFTPKRTVKYFIADYVVLFIACMILWPLLDLLFANIFNDSYEGWNAMDSIVRPAIFALIATAIEFIFWNFFHKKRK